MNCILLTRAPMSYFGHHTLFRSK